MPSPLSTQGKTAPARFDDGRLLASVLLCGTACHDPAWAGARHLPLNAESDGDLSDPADGKVLVTPALVHALLRTQIATRVGTTQGGVPAI